MKSYTEQELHAIDELGKLYQRLKSVTKDSEDKESDSLRMEILDKLSKII